MARGASALIQDLKQRGLLEDTLILWTTEFGRMPSSPRRQRPRPQSVRVSPTGSAAAASAAASASVPATNGATSPLDRDNSDQVYDIHATILHLLGIDHERLTVRHNGIDRRLTDVTAMSFPNLIAVEGLVR